VEAAVAVLMEERRDDLETLRITLADDIFVQNINVKIEKRIFVYESEKLKVKLERIKNS
jgi:hypothetical protein